MRNSTFTQGCCRINCAEQGTRSDTIKGRKGIAFVIWQCEEHHAEYKELCRQHREKVKD